MPTTNTKNLTRTVLLLGLLVAALYPAVTLSPPVARADSCDVAAFIECSNLGLSMNPNTCECVPYCPLISADCTEQGFTGLDYNTCQCTGGEMSALTVCDFNPYALGCPNSFDTIFSGVTEYYGTGQCSRTSAGNCATIGGFYNYTSCSCNVATVTGFCSNAAITSCQNSGGTISWNCTCSW
jgi:hypothetical protein